MIINMTDDGAAIALLKRAVELDIEKRYTEALVCYKEGLQLLLEFIKVWIQTIGFAYPFSLSINLTFHFRQSMTKIRKQSTD